MEDGTNTGLVVHEGVTLGEDEDAVPRYVVLLEKLSNDAFRLAIGIHVSGIDGRHTAIPGGLEERQGLIFVDDPWRPFRGAKGHGADDGH